MDPKKSSYLDKQFRDSDKKAAESDYEKARKQTLARTAKLKALRLAKEAEDEAAASLKPKKSKKAAGKRKLPAFERE